MSSVKVSAADVKKLRDTTGAPMMDCKKALVEADADFEKAIEILRKKGQKMSLKRADRETKEGVVIALVSDDHSTGVVVRLSCETDFVAKNDDFVKLAQTIAEIALDGKPDTIEALREMPMANGLSIQDKITEQIGVIGEKVEVAEYYKVQAPTVAPYVHMGYKAGVLVGLNKNGEGVYDAGRDVAMQIAAMKPIAVDENGVDASIVEKEIEIGKEQARLEGKPEAMLEKIALGKLNKFYKESTLLHQQFVKDNKLSVAQYLQGVDKDLTVTAFKHIELG
jgi:elongation factor Ts